ncbi:membrane protein [Terrihabitans soli]|uniref:Membrane protein n=1 Tax=Terrihabitans soli TaxID=708113 RepID=A0A6S6QVU6_9HYPH|nr:DUF599 family protein [Terrihabitans soli]BCJ91150.1 membrane protein [Terrihabitans soli]
MSGFTVMDGVALAIFGAAWLIYYLYVERSTKGHESLNALMHDVRVTWMRRVAARDNRVFDGQLMTGLQNGTAFFASSAFLAIGGALSALGFADAALDVFGALPFSTPATREMFELKVLGLAVIFAYSFFKFVWSYRLFNYVAILMGAMPPAGHPDAAEVEESVQRSALMNISAARHFNRGLRAYFFALAYLGWFGGPAALMLTTILVAIVLWRRQFSSDSVLAATWTQA